MYTLSKVLAVSRPVVKLSGGESEKFFIREESYDILVENELLCTVFAVPEHMEEFVIGYLLSSGVIDRFENVLSYRLCDRNKIYVLLKKELSDAVKAAGGLHYYLAGLPRKGWGDLLPLRSSKSYMPEQVKAICALVEAHPHIQAVSELAYYAAYTTPEAVSYICADTNKAYAVDKIAGYILTQKPSGGFVVTNARPCMDTVRTLYRANECMAVFCGVPTNAVYFFAGKISFTVISKDTADGEYYLFADSAGRIAKE